MSGLAALPLALSILAIATASLAILWLSEAMWWTGASGDQIRNPPRWVRIAGRLRGDRS